MSEVFTLTGKRIWVAGHAGMVGSALVRRLAKENCEVLTMGREQLDLRDQAATNAWIVETKPDAIILAAAKVGGILANASYPADFLHDNLMIATNVISAAHQNDVDRLLYLGSSCIYPRDAAQPIEEHALLSGPLEQTNEAYAIAKIAGLKLVKAYRTQHGRDYINAMPTNLYGPGDNFDLETSHVLPALMRKVHEAKMATSPFLEIWGTGTPRREFLHVDDCADALVFLLKNYSDIEHINVGSGDDISIEGLANLVCEIVGYHGPIAYDRSKPDGTPRKLMASGKLMKMAWTPKTSLRQGIEQTYQWYLENHA
ncbi:MAG: GDP-L-fucose synthase family protein [Devosiaceae bacterium]